MVRSILKAKFLPRQFWIEAACWSVYILNLYPIKNLYHKTFQEVWTGYKPDASHLKVFGCIAYAYMLDKKRKKLDDKGEAYIFIGYSEYSKAYKFYNPIFKNIMISRNVIFDEEIVFK